MIRKITVQNFRSLKSISIPFEEDITVIGGENDCGKTSVIDVIKNVFNNENNLVIMWIKGNNYGIFKM